MTCDPVRTEKWHLPAIAVVVALTVAAFGGAVGHDFVDWDDPANLTDNLSYRGLSPAHIEWMFTTTHVGVYQPLGWLLFSLTDAVFGQSPAGFHAVSVVVHASTAAAFYFLIVGLLRRVYAQPGVPAGAGVIVPAVVGAAVFAVHPLRTECVAWASGQPYVLAGLFCILSVLAYLRAAAARSRVWTAVSVGLFALSLLSKAIAMPLPLVLILLDLYVLGRLGGETRRWYQPATRGVWLEKVPYLILAGACAWMAVYAGSSDPRTPDLGPAAMLALPPYILAFHTIRTLFPIDLSPCYDLPSTLASGQWRYGLAAIFVAGVTVVALLVRRRRPAVWAVWLVYVFMLAPYLRFVPHGPQLTADRYSYLACLGYAFLAAVGVRLAWCRGRRHAALVVSVVVVVMLTFLSRQQCAVWRNSQTLWTYAVMVDPHSPTALLGLAAAREQGGRPDEGAALAERALGLRPADAMGHVVLSECLLATGEAAEAEVHARQAVSLGATGWRGELTLAKALAARGRHVEAVELLEQVSDKLPVDMGLFNKLGIAWSQAGELPRSVEVLQRALELAPHDLRTQRNLASAVFRAGDFAEAARLFALVRSGDPSDADSVFFEAESRVRLGQYSAAADAYARVLAREPEHAQYLVGYSWLLSSCPEPEHLDGVKALSLAKKAVGITGPDDVAALDCLAAAQARCGRFAEAAATASQAVGIAIDKGWTDRAEQIRARQTDYEAGRPTANPAWTKQ